MKLRKIACKNASNFRLLHFCCFYNPGLGVFFREKLDKINVEGGGQKPEKPHPFFF